MGRPEPHVGTSGWSYPGWRGIVYPSDLPARRWFSHYATLFRTVEINNTFYRLPAVETFRAWREQAPPGFVYAVKASRYLTHIRRLKNPAEPLARFFDGAGELGPHLGPVLYQLPPHWGVDAPRLREFVAALPRGVRHVVEIRDPSWGTEEIRELLHENGVGFCIHDLQGRAWPEWVTAPFAYFRFHGPGEAKYQARYTVPHLRRRASRIRELLSTGLEVYAYFNNDTRGHAVANALKLLELLDERRSSRAG